MNEEALISLKIVDDYITMSLVNPPHPDFPKDQEDLEAHPVYAIALGIIKKIKDDIANMKEGDEE